MDQLRKKKGFICDMDGVIYHGNRLLPGVKEFVDWLYQEKKHFLFLTNSSERSPKELQQKLFSFGPDIEILSPEWMRQDFAEKILEAAKKYFSLQAQCKEGK